MIGNLPRRQAVENRPRGIVNLWDTEQSLALIDVQLLNGPVKALGFSEDEPAIIADEGAGQRIAVP